MDNTYIIIIGGLLWAVCTQVSYCTYFNYTRAEYPSIAESSKSFDKRVCFMISLTGPISILAITILGYYKHGWRIK
jgi:hypothetical protein